MRDETSHQLQQHIEDDWKTLSIPSKSFSFKVEGSCPRCTMVDYDPVTGQKGKTLRALARYRRQNGRIVFGIFLQAIMSRQNSESISIEEGDVFRCT